MPAAGTTAVRKQAVGVGDRPAVMRHTLYRTMLHQVAERIACGTSLGSTVCARVRTSRRTSRTGGSGVLAARATAIVHATGFGGPARARVARRRIGHTRVHRVRVRPRRTRTGSLAMLDALRDRGAHVLLPIAREPGPLSWATYDGTDALVRAPYGLREPAGPAQPPERHRHRHGGAGARAGGRPPWRSPRPWRRLLRPDPRSRRTRCATGRGGARRAKWSTNYPKTRTIVRVGWALTPAARTCPTGHNRRGMNSGIRVVGTADCRVLRSLVRLRRTRCPLIHMPAPMR